MNEAIRYLASACGHVTRCGVWRAEEMMALYLTCANELGDNHGEAERIVYVMP